MIDEYIVDHDEYVGAGSGSFGYVRGTCFANTFSLDEYVSSIHRGKVPLTAKRDFSLREQVHYYFMMKLFGSRIDLREAEIKFNGHFEETIRKEIFLLRFLGALDVQAETMRLTNKGRYFWVIMMREFFTGVNNFRDLCRATMKGPDDCMD
jgi:coproporphyrinogen III oxidase-like Fe-S oxidoreductase